MTIPAYPLQWPDGWKRTVSYNRDNGAFKRDGSALSIAAAVGRVRDELRRFGVSEDDLVVSTNLRLRLDGFPRSDQGEPSDPGVAVYWETKSRQRRCMAIDRYKRVAQNIAAVAATLEAMRAIERHGGAEVLDRAFTGFTALPAPEGSKPWYVVLGCPPNASTEHVRTNYRKARSEFHPDRPGGDADTFDAIQRAWQQACAALGISE